MFRVGVLGFRIQRYGITKHKDLFTPRQLIALTTFSDLIPHVYEEVLLNSQGDRAYANMIATFLAFSISRFVQTNSTLVRWYVRKSGTSKGIPSLDRQIVSMVWEFSEGNVFGSSVGSWLLALKNPLLALKALPEVAIPGIAVQQDAASHLPIEGSLVASLDPPYFNNVGYADLSDFYYVWLRKALSNIYPDLFTTLLVPKKEELIAAPHMFDGNRSKGEQHFLEGLRNAFRLLRKQAHPDYPLTIYYAFKQAEEEEDANEQGQGIGVSSTGWETMLEALLEAGFTVSGTWPMRTEKISRLRAVGSNALASSIVLVCRPRAVDASHTSRGEFLRSLKRELPEALKKLQHGSIAPVDLAQAAIGPGMGVFSRSGKVLEADGSTMRVRTALQLINQTLDEVLAEQEGEYDVETRWAIAWFEQYGMEEGPYGVAETLSKAKNTAVERLVENGMLSARAGKVRLLRREEISETWNPAHQERLTVWEVTQRLIRALDRGGEEGAAAILARTGTLGELARDLAYRLYSTCERNDWAQEALAYNSLVAEWRGIAGQAAPRLGIEQAALFE